MFSSKVGIINIPKFTKSLWKNQIAKTSFVRQASSGQSADQLKEFKDDTADYLGETKTSAAMIAYLKRAQAHTEFIEKHSHEFQVGRRHLANIMGRDPETFTQEDIDESIEYLFPSGLFEPLARPMMKPPETIFAAKKEAEFDESGKPFHWLFYTTYPNFFELLHNVVGKMKELNRFEDEQIRKGLTPPENSAVSMGGMEWLPKKLLDKKLLEEIPEDAYKQFLALMDRFIQHPYAYLAADTYEPVRKSLLDKRKQIVELEPQFTEDGRTYITTTDNTKRPAVAKVTVYNPGTGKFTVNGEDLLYFKDVQSREQVLFPLLMSGMLNKVDIEAEVWGSVGQSKQAIAVRYGIARGLFHFVDEETKQNMRIAGLLTKDPRNAERKKPGQEGARRKFTWKKR